jgi:hypothetical protein
MAKLEPGTCGCGFTELDTDLDGTPDCNDECPADDQKTAAGVCGCGFSDVDEDNDGYAACLDACPLDPYKTSPGVCGCGTVDKDTDKDGTLDCQDQCPYDMAKTAPGACGCSVAETDSDGDGIPNCNDNCPYVANADQDASVCECFCCENKPGMIAFQWQGEDGTALTIQNKDGKNMVDVTTEADLTSVNHGDTIEVYGTRNKGDFGANLFIQYGSTTIKIHTSCSQAIGAGLDYGDVLITAVRDIEDRALCDISYQISECSVNEVPENTTVSTVFGTAGVMLVFGAVVMSVRRRLNRGSYIGDEADEDDMHANLGSTQFENEAGLVDEADVPQLEMVYHN